MFILKNKTRKCNHSSGLPLAEAEQNISKRSCVSGSSVSFFQPVLAF